MSRKPIIMWRKSDAERLDKEIQRFNKKIYNTRQRNPELASILPDTIKKSDRDKMIADLKQAPRNEFNKKINSLDRFIRRDALTPVTSKTGNTVSKWERQEVAYKVAQINRDRTRERKAVENMDATSRGVDLGLKRGEMGSARLNALNPKKFNFDKIRSGKEWGKFKASIDKLSDPKAKAERMNEYKDNYIKGLENAFGGYADDIINIIKELDADIVVKTFYSEQEATIDFFYEPQEMNLKLDMLGDLWSGVQDQQNEIRG